MIAPIRSEIQLRDVLACVRRNKGYGKKLEAALAEYFSVEKVQLTHSGRSALYFLLRALPQEKVYLPAYNCWAVAEAVMYAKKQIEYVDISLEDFNMDLARLRDVLEPGSIIIATHQFGIPCDIDAILRLASERHCFVIEDNAAAFGSEIGGKKTGGFADAAILSFDNAKTVVSGKGGAILFNDVALYDKVREIYALEVGSAGIFAPLKSMVMALGYCYATHKRVYPFTYAIFKAIRGSSRARKDNGPESKAGYRLGFDDMRAKLAYLSLKRVDEVIKRREGLAEFYLADDALSAVISLPVVAEQAKAVFIKIPFRPKRLHRALFYEQCKAQGVDPEYLFPYHYGDDQSGFPNARAAAKQGMALPMYSRLSDEDVWRIKSAIKSVRDPDNEIAQDVPTAHVETRKLFFFTLSYYWMNKEAFLATHQRIALLRTHEELSQNEFHLRFCYKTFLIDLSKTKEDIFAAFDAKGARYEIRKASRCGVIVKQATSATEKMQFYDFYQEFVEHPQRKGKILVLQKSELARLHVFFALSAEGEYLGGIGLLPSPDGRLLLYKYAATLHRTSENELMLWQAIQYAKDAGFEFFDMSWMTLTDDKASDAYRLYRFKRKFGGELVDFYTYVKFNGALKLLAKPFEWALNRFFGGDINQFALFLKKIKVFK